MRRILCSVLVLLTLGGCGRHDERPEPAPQPEVASLLALARSPEAELDPLDAPPPPRGFARADVLRLAAWLVDAVERTGTADPDAIVTARDAADHTFTALDMRSRVRIGELLESTSRDSYDGMPVDWMLVDRWEPGHEPASPGRVIRAAWDARVDHGELEVSLQVLQAYVSVKGEPMFIDRTFALSSADPSRAPAVQVWFGSVARVVAVDRCHVVDTGRFRPDPDPERLQRAVGSVRKQIAAQGVSPLGDGDFRRGCD